MSHLTIGLNNFWKAPYFSKVHSTPTGTIFRGVNNEETNTITTHMNLYQKWEVEQVGEEVLGKTNDTFLNLFYQNDSFGDMNESKTK